MNVGEKIKQIRTVKKISQAQVAEYLNMSVNGYRRLESGRGRFHMQRLEKIAELLDIDISELLTNTTNFVCVISEHGAISMETANDNIFNHNSNQELFDEIIQAKNEIIEQQKQRIQLLETMLGMK